MTPGEIFRVVVFITTLVGVYVLAPAVLLRWVRSRGKERLFCRTVDFIIVVTALVGIGCAIDAFREPYRPEVTHLTVPLAKLAPGSQIRIVQISDVHSNGRPRLEEKLPGIIAAEHPDLIVFTGDAVNGPQGLPVFHKLMSSLVTIAPVFAIRGNWDTDPRLNRKLYEETGVRELKRDVVELNIRGQNIAILGHAFYWQPAAKMQANLSPDLPTMALVHSPDAVFDALHAGIVFAGHTHGGQIRLPWYGALVTLSKYGKRFEAGLYRVEDTWLYVNRGIGMEEDAPVRFLCRPEVAVVDLIGPPNGPNAQ